MKCDGVIFDMDGVLVTNSAYCEAIKRTVELVLWNKFRINKEITTEYIDEIKSLTGFNNDWDTSYALIELLGNNVTIDEFSQKVKLITPKRRKSTWYKKVKDIFQTFYLGDRLFQEIYSYVASFKNKIGLITTETLLIDIKVLDKLAQNYKLGIATSRPRFEALFAVKNLRLTPNYISEALLIAKEDVIREKPEPDPLLEVQRRMRAKKPIYVGDTVNDTVAAQKANMPCIFVGLKKLGDFQISEINKIKEILL
ncbi:hypothetical protein A2W14_03405 [Candidatus Gottesmanbacteria bacterium RBG_16_37_8]|uniref:HAD family hydrolase n=1 Tax=Candidatus Gottesmanbacteria bacterium RBG_16_37_8 TaxID=1798371 RepID=A0A1F5YU09_9BACT|nr:MAG: hypothetical protein A2W14_03405 [Candidatus Gottesmanbacteria bacterium RBG_16_37_8]